MNLRQIVHRTGLLAALVMPAFAVQAMEQLDDQQMATTTGQEGVTIGLKLPQSTFAFDQIQLVNVDNRAVANSGRASLVIAPRTVATNDGVRFLTSSGVNPTVNPFVITVDADGNGGSPTANINFALPTDLAFIVIDPLSVYLADGSGNVFTNRATNTVRAGTTEVLRTGRLYSAVTSPIALNFQFGAESQTSMLRFASGSFSVLLADAGAPIELMSQNTSGQSSLKFNLDIRASNPTGFSLVGFYADINANGLVLGKNGLTDKLNIQVNNVTAGTAGGTPTTAFNGTLNAPLGNFGVQGLQIQNLRVNVSGM